VKVNSFKGSAWRNSLLRGTCKIWSNMCSDTFASLQGFRLLFYTDCSSPCGSYVLHSFVPSCMYSTAVRCSLRIMKLLVMQSSPILGSPPTYARMFISEPSSSAFSCSPVT
jgi:hypothetical protein